ncbi:hypothetical protein ACOMHN_058596 [Nucella lapillus]
MRTEEADDLTFRSLRRAPWFSLLPPPPVVDCSVRARQAESCCVRASTQPTLATLPLFVGQTSSSAFVFVRSPTFVPPLSVLCLASAGRLFKPCGIK